MNRHSASTRALVEAALMIALATILGYFRLYRFPQGGSVDFAMVPILIYCLRWGPAWSLSCCLSTVCSSSSWAEGSLYPGSPCCWTMWWLIRWYSSAALPRGRSWAGCGAPSWPGWDGGYLSPLSGGLLWYMYMPEEFLGLPMVDPWVYSMIFNGVLIVLVTVVNLIVLGIFQSVPALRQKLLTKQN